MNADVGSVDTRFSYLQVEVIPEPITVVKPASNIASLVDVLRTSSENDEETDGCKMKKNDSYSVWHHRLGHAPMSKLKHIQDVSTKISDSVCITCPMVKMFKFPFYQSKIASASVFELLYMDI